MRRKLAIFSSLILMFAFQNCSNVAFENNRVASSLGSPGSTGSTTGDTGQGTGGDSATTGPQEQVTIGDPTGTTTGQGTTTGIEEVTALCDGPDIQTASYPVSWASNWSVSSSTTLCQWDLNPNGSRILANDFVMARNEEPRSFQLPENAVLCEMSITSPSQIFEYDDMFLLTLNGIVVASATSWFQGFAAWEGMQVYNWDDIKGDAWPQNYNGNSFIYCVGEAESLSTCNIPPTQTSGNFNMSIGNSLVQRIGLRAPTTTHEFRLIVTGDDNPSVDCRHKALSLNVNVRYALRPTANP